MSGARITINKRVTLTYRVTDSDGRLVDSSDQHGPLTYVHGYGQVVAGLERQLEGLQSGAVGTFFVAANEGFGTYDSALLFQVPRTRFNFPLALNQVIEAQVSDNLPMPFTVVAIDETEVTLDGNHPLSGRDLEFCVQVLEVRDATEEEL